MSVVEDRIAEALKFALKDLEDHKRDDLPTRRFLAGVVDGLKKALLIASRKSK